MRNAHDLQLTDEHFNRAVNEQGHAEKAQNAAQKAHEPAGTEQKDNPEEESEGVVGSGDSSDVPLDSETFETVSMTGLGIEPRTCGLKGRCSTN